MLPVFYLLCGKDLGEALVLKVEDVNQDVGQEKGRNIPRIITTPEPECALRPEMPLPKPR